MQNVYLKKVVKAALAEDIGIGDITSNSLISFSTQTKAGFIFKSAGIVCGLNVVKCVFEVMDPKIKLRSLIKDGAKVKKETVIAYVSGPARSILTAERVAINFLTHLSAIATRTSCFVEAVAGTKARIYDTRKTTPLLRPLERYAVQIGGGRNHRFDLSEMAMIKDNHRLLLARLGLKEAVDAVKSKTGRKVVLEVDSLEEFREALGSKAEVILLDNMTPSQVKEAVLLRNRFNPRVQLEASGGMNLSNVRDYAKTGVERISIGTLSSVRERIDISLDFKT